MRSLSIILVAVVVAFAAERADACGGMFCSQTSPTPIDQSAEKILFEVNADGSVTATVEIKYNGNPQDFAWIVPVSGPPDFVEVAEKDELLLLDQATQVSIIPPTTTCTNPPAQPLFSSGFGCACAEQALGGLPLEGGDDTLDGVNVTQYPSVGPFDDIIVVGGQNPDVLMNYLRDNQYQVTEEMRPFIEQYTLEGHSFLATRLRADAATQDMVPIRFHCPQPNPTIPLRLTAVAAEPDMGFLVFVAGPSRYQLAPGYENVELDIEELQTSNGVTNYFALVAREMDEVGGRGFVVERASRMDAIALGTFLGTENEQAARESLVAQLADQPFITRFYTRMSAEEMTIDPVFVPVDGDSVEVNGFDLSSRVYDQCPAGGADPQFPPQPPTCGTVYCGQGDACGVDEFGNEGCLCRREHVARVTTSPTGTRQVICTSTEIDVHGGNGNPCAGQTCGGRGTCLPVNDRPTCACEEGTIAVLDNSTIVCRPFVGDIFEADQISWPEPEGPPPREGGCSSSANGGAGGAASILLWFAAVAVMRRVLRRV